MIGAISGSESSHRASLVLAIGQVVIWHLKNRSPVHFSNQVRIIFLLLVAASFLPLFHSLKWGLAVGTLSTALLGYCPIARVLVLMPLKPKRAINNRIGKAGDTFSPRFICLQGGSLNAKL